jgi:hypothetical protein
MNIMYHPTMNVTNIEASQTFGEVAIVETHNVGFWNFTCKYFFKEQNNSSFYATRD